jgi:hypothetical protein
LFAAVGREASFAAVTTAVYLLSADGVIESVNFGGEAPNTTIGLVLGQYGYVDEFQERLSFSAATPGFRGERC